MSGQVIGDVVFSIAEQRLRRENGEPSCALCRVKENCLIAFMGGLVKVKPSYLPGFGCGQFAPKTETEEQR